MLVDTRKTLFILLDVVSHSVSLFKESSIRFRRVTLQHTESLYQLITLFDVPTIDLDEVLWDVDCRRQWILDKKDPDSEH